MYIYINCFMYLNLPYNKSIMKDFVVGCFYYANRIKYVYLPMWNIYLFIFSYLQGAKWLTHKMPCGTITMHHKAPHVTLVKCHVDITWDAAWTFFMRCRMDVAWTTICTRINDMSASDWAVLIHQSGVHMTFSYQYKYA